jgi:hypothetical protein
MYCKLVKRQKPLERRENMNEYFTYIERLGIHIPILNNEWESISKTEQQAILFEWEKIRGMIPDRIAEIEDTINKKQAELSDEHNFPRSCRLNSEISDLASVINDLWIWYRTNQNSISKTHF